MLPALGVVSTKYPELAPFLTALKEIIEVRDGRIGDPLERFVTLRELADVDLLNVARLGRLGTVLSPGGAIGAPDLTIPPVPTGLAASGAIQSIILDWFDPWALYGNHSYTEIWRADVDDLGAAVLVGQSPSFVWVDQVDTGLTKYYWIRFVSTANIVGPFNSIPGTVATTGFLLTGDLADLAVTAGKIADAAVTGPKVAAAAIGNTQLAALAVDAAKLADSAVTATKIANLAVGTAAIADAAIGSVQIADAAVGSAAIANLAVGTAHVQDAAIVNAKIGALAVDSAKIADLAVLSAKIANAAITTAKIADANITTAKIVDANITTAKIADAAIVNAKIANAAIGTANIIDANITTLKLSGQAVTIPSSAYTAGGISIPTTYVDIQSVTYTSTGAPTIISFSHLMDNMGVSGEKYRVLLARNGTTIYETSGDIFMSDSTVLNPFSASISDTPPAGSVTYTLRAKQNMSGVDVAFSRNRSITALETKR